MNVTKRQLGFTLIELIIALLILSMVVVLCASGFKFGTRVWNSIDVQAEHIDTIQAVQGFIRSNMSNAHVHDQFVEDEDSEQAPESLFIGDDHSVRYVSNSPRYGVDDYLYQYELFLDRDTNKLLLRYQPYNVPVQASVAESVSTLLEGVEDIQIEYFSGYQGESGDDSPWASRWGGEFTLPLLVKINVTTINGSQVWPELVIQTRNGPYVIR